MPGDPENHDKSHKYPFVASNVLNANQTICQALLEGGWSQDDPEEEEEATEEPAKSQDESSDKSDEENKASPEDSDKPKEEPSETSEEKTDQSTPAESFKEASGDLDNIVAAGLMKDKAAQEETE